MIAVDINFMTTVRKAVSQHGCILPGWDTPYNVTNTHEDGGGVTVAQPITAACPKRPPKQFDFKFKRPEAADWTELW